ncbi:hypothetical protein KSP9073_03478 [Kushneria phyllosphaerae]|uniref:Uncharacterized protein n=1 Tax=Kushneria phyllosphaerae TaxID=2100822 RepID=A0A2R8CRE5_9GAMM|nr:hypothetical protein KSP9073_03478 [Kushneria phyllosphaerae]
MADGGADGRVLCQLTARHVDREGTVRVHRAGPGLLAHRQDHGVAGSIFTGNSTCDRYIAPCLVGVDDVVTGNGVELNGQRRGRGVDAIRTSGLGTADVTRGIGMTYRGRNAVGTGRRQYRARHRDAERAVLCDRRCIALVAHADRHRIAGRGIPTGLTGNGDITGCFGGIDHVIAGNRIQ